MRQAVKCSAKSLRQAFLGLVSGLSVLAVSTARAQLLLGKSGAEGAKAPQELDPGIPTGGFATGGTRPKDSGAPCCSFHRPVCVHAPGVPEHAVMAWLSALETAEDRLTTVMGLPLPLADDDRGGGPELDLYIGARNEGVRAEVDAWDTPARWDAASAFCVAGAREGSIERAATLCVAEAIALRLDASETPFSRRALATELWHAVGFPTSADAEAIDEFQSHPELTPVARERSRYAEGSALWLEFLNGAKGGREPASIGLAAFVLSSGDRGTADLRFVNEPDTLDVLRNNFGGTPTDFARLVGDFAVRRAFVGARDAEGYFPGEQWTSSFGRVRFEWSIPFSSLPRTLAPLRAIEPLGSTYVWVSFDGATKPGTLLFVADWEPPVSFKWNLTLLSREGRVLRMVDVPFLERGTHVERTLTDLEGAGVLVSGTNLGGIGPTYPFDPDFEPFEPHGYVVYLGKE